MKRARRFFLHVKHEDHAVWRRALTRGDRHLLEIAEGVCPLLAQTQIRRRVPLAFVDAQFTSDDRVLGLCVARDLDALDLHTRAALHGELEAQGVVFFVRNELRLDVDERVAGIAVTVGEGLHVRRHLGAREQIAAANLCAVEQLLAIKERVGVDGARWVEHVDDEVAADVHRTQPVLLAFSDRDREREARFILAQLHARLADSDVDETAILVDRFDGEGVDFAAFDFVRAPLGEQPQRMGFAGAQDGQDVVGGDRVVADQDDLFDLHLGGFGDDEDDVDELALFLCLGTRGRRRIVGIAVGDRFVALVGEDIEQAAALALAGGARRRTDLVADLGEEVALVDVELLDLRDVGAHPRDVEDLKRLEVDDVFDVVFADLAVALVEHLVERRLFGQLVDKDDRLVFAFTGLDHDILKDVHVPDAAHVALQRFAIGLAIDAALDVHKDGVGLDLLDADDPHFGDHAGFGLVRDENALFLGAFAGGFLRR